MKNTGLLVACAFVFGVMIGIHRRVIKAVITGSPIPEAPASHFLVKNHRTED